MKGWSGWSPMKQTKIPLGPIAESLPEHLDPTHINYHSANNKHKRGEIRRRRENIDYAVKHGHRKPTAWEEIKSDFTDMPVSKVVKKADTKKQKKIKIKKAKIIRKK